MGALWLALLWAETPGGGGGAFDSRISFYKLQTSVLLE